MRLRQFVRRLLEKWERLTGEDISRREGEEAHVRFEEIRRNYPEAIRMERELGRKIFGP